MVRDRSELLIFGCGVVGLVLIAAVLAYGEPSPPSGNQPPSNNGNPPGNNQGRDHGPPTYQRQAFDWRYNDRDWRRYDRRWQPWMMPQESSGWFQRPYPYHLDYYKMRWGGSYAPYFGNLYGTPFGTPQVVYGGWGPGPTNWGATFAPPGYEWQEVPQAETNSNGAAPTAATTPSAPSPLPNNQKTTDQPDSESLPAPKN